MQTTSNLPCVDCICLAICKGHYTKLKLIGYTKQVRRNQLTKKCSLLENALVETILRGVGHEISSFLSSLHDYMDGESFTSDELWNITEETK